jgi:hypothetical protein
MYMANQYNTNFTELQSHSTCPHFNFQNHTPYLELDNSVWYGNWARAEWTTNQGLDPGTG